MDLKNRFESLEERHPINSKYKLSNILMCGFALFSIKDSSLFRFTNELKNRASNLKNIFPITQAPSDSTIRTLLDKVPTKKRQPLFKPYLEELDQQRILKDDEFIKGALLVPLDGTQYFDSQTVHCEHCQTKKHKNAITYHHNALAAVIVSPTYREVFPVSIEDIVKQDGHTKNDSE